MCADKHSSMPRYALIACPRCREHAQIVEMEVSKTTRCQKCGSSLKIRKLRIFYASDCLDEVIAARTSLQAQLHGSGSEAMFPDFHSLEKDSTNCIEVFADRRNKRPSRAPREIIFDLLRSEGGSMELEVLRSHALEYMSVDRFEKAMEGLFGCGELYTPSTGVVRMV